MASVGVRKPPNRKARNQVNIRLTDEEAKVFRAAAEASGLNLATWIRVACRKLAGLPTV